MHDHLFSELLTMSWFSIKYCIVCTVQFERRERNGAAERGIVGGVERSGRRGRSQPAAARARLVPAPAAARLAPHTYVQRQVPGILILPL